MLQIQNDFFSLSLRIFFYLGIEHTTYTEKLQEKEKILEVKNKDS